MSTFDEAWGYHWLSVLIYVLLSAHSFKMSISHVPNTVLRTRDRAEPISLVDCIFESV